MQQRILMVSNRLPVTINTNHHPYTLSRSLGGLATSLSAIGELYDTIWIGWAGNQKPLSEQEFADLILPDRLLPVNIPKQLFHRYYNRVSNAVLWPTLHSMKPPIQTRADDWNAVRSVASLFAETIVSQLKSGDIIWIHDFHFILLVQALRARGVTNKIGFFLHTPFPDPAVFGTITEHRPLLVSLAMADLVGFQTERDRVNFVAALQKTSIKPCLQMKTGTFPIGINFDLHAEANKLPTVQQRYTELHKQFAGKYVVLSISRLDYTKGILEQLESFEKAVLEHGLDDITYRLIVAPSRESRVEYRRLERNIAHLVNAINRRLQRKGRTAYISFEYRNHDFNEVSAWYRLADMLLITPSVDGMNLVAKEYVAVRSKPGTLVLSQTAGAAVQLAQAILVDPHNTSNIAEGIYRAYSMDKDEITMRWRAMKRNIRSENIFAWAKAFIAAVQHGA